MGILCLTSCSATFVSIDKLPKYGSAVPGTIHVLASHGFKRQGHYYLPKGATLGLLIDIAGWKPVSAEKFAIRLWGDMWLFREESRFLLVQHNWGQDYKTDYYVSWLDKNGIPYQHRQRPLLDGDRVMRSGFLY
jgi:hypothetical protein